MAAERLPKIGAISGSVTDMISDMIPDLSEEMLGDIFSNVSEDAYKERVVGSFAGRAKRPRGTQLPMEGHRRWREDGVGSLRGARFRQHIRHHKWHQ